MGLEGFDDFGYARAMGWELGICESVASAGICKENQEFVGRERSLSKTNECDVFVSLVLHFRKSLMLFQTSILRIVLDVLP